jgi:hypothetical protein
MDSDYLILNPTYENLKMTFPESYPTRQFHVIYLPITWLHQWKKNKKLKTAFGIVPRLSSLMDTTIRTRDFQFEAYVLNVLKKSDDLTLKFGLYYNTQYFRLLVIPLLGVEWKINSRWSMFGVLPGSLNLDHEFTSSIHTGLQFRSITNNYYTSSYNYIRVNDYQLKAYTDFYLSKRNVLTLHVGHTIFRKFRSAYRDTGLPEYEPMNVAGGWLFRVGYSFRVNTEVNRIDAPRPNK